MLMTGDEMRTSYNERLLYCHRSHIYYTVGLFQHLVEANKMLTMNVEVLSVLKTYDAECG